MRITEIIQPKSSSAVVESKAQYAVPQDAVSQVCVSAIAEGVSQILRRVKGKGLRSGFRCTSGTRKGRIVAKPSTCFARKDTKRAYKIAKKRQQKARQTGLKMGITKRARPGSTRLKSAQLKRKLGFKTRGKTSRFQKSKVIK